MSMLYFVQQELVYSTAHGLLGYVQSEVVCCVYLREELVVLRLYATRYSTGIFIISSLGF